MSTAEEEQTAQASPAVTLDLGLLSAFDERAEQPASLEDAAAEATTALLHALFSLPVSDTPDGRLITPPPPTSALPREKPIPKPRPPTKWEKFSKEKGIQKKRRDRLVLDDATGEYVPRYGKGSKNSLDRDVIIPHKEGMGTDYDPFAEKRKEKKQRIKDNDKKRRANLGRASNAARLDPMQALNVAATGPSGKRYLPKSGLDDSLAVAQRSTASAGRFDKRGKNEPTPKNRGRKKLPASTGRRGLEGEKARSQKIADQILKG